MEKGDTAGRNKPFEQSLFLFKGEERDIWLMENIYQYGSSLFPQELIRRVTGHDLSSEPFVAYLKRKYL